MPEYTYTVRSISLNEELWAVASDGTRYLVVSIDGRDFDRVQREERAIEALYRLDVSTVHGRDALRRIVRAVLDA